MKCLSFFSALMLGFISFSQESNNEILQVAQLRKDCVQRSLCEVKVYPNPSNGPVHVDAPNGAECKVFSTSGTYVGTWIVGEQGLDLVDLTSGAYVTMVSYNNITRVNRLLIL
jgi:pSer/pThr/pTyr-binding forkhead associated (FHA) protein